MAMLKAYGNWSSPLSADLVTRAQRGIGQISVNRGRVLFAESRPAEAGRTVLLGQTADRWDELSPSNFNLRSRVHEYGGSAYAADGGIIVAVDHLEQCLNRIDPGPYAQPLTPRSGAKLRFAEPVIDRMRGRVIAICEDQRGRGEPQNSIVSIALNGSQRIDTLVSGDDFYGYPTLSPDGQQLSWIAWNHPDMPWDGSVLRVAAFTSNGTLGRVGDVAGGRGEAVLQPRWRADGALVFVSDRSGYWNLWDERGRCLWEVEADCGGPLWQLGTRWFDIDTDGGIIACVVRDGRWGLVRVEPAGGVRDYDLPFADIGGIVVEGRRALFRAAAEEMPAVVAALDVVTGACETLYRSGELPVRRELIARPRSLRFASTEGRTAHAFYYPPTNPKFVGPADARPPAIVCCHGGPTGAASAALRLAYQFWTSRGFAVCDVDYGGSTGYGRAFRDSIKGRWGIVDVEDCVAAADHLVAAGLADPDRLIIRGGSAGGFTVLCALTFHDRFKAGASSYGIGDLELLARDTHKFESRYLESLVGAYPQEAEVYRARSPINHTEKLNCPVIFFQGLDDKVVPPNQAETMVSALKTKGLPVAYLTFEGEGHGFRAAETQIRVLLSELAFYAAIFALRPADELPPLEIANHHRR